MTIDADERQKELLLDIVRRKDVTGLNDLIIRQYPDVLWGGVYRTLSPEDRKWVDDNLLSR